MWFGGGETAWDCEGALKLGLAGFGCALVRGLRGARRDYKVSVLRTGKGGCL